MSDPGTAEPSPRSVAVVLNGAAGALLDRPDAMAGLETAFAEAGLSPRFVPQEAGSLPERIGQAAAMGASAVIAAGGDGTIACAAQALAGTDMPLGVLPFGTMNLLAKDLGIPVGDTAAALQVLAAGRVRAVDVAEVNGRVFLCASMLGLPARLGRYREAQRGAGPAVVVWSRIGVNFVRSVWRHRRMRAVLELDGRAVPVHASSVNVTVNALDDASGRVFGRSCLDGGTLVVYVIRRLTLTRVLVLGWKMLRGNWRRDGALEVHPVRRLVVSGRRAGVSVMNDGELMTLEAPLTYTIRPGALKVIAP